MTLDRPIPIIGPDTTPCCVCPPTCDTDETGDTCIDASCAVCLHGCPAGLDRPCCRDFDLPTTDASAARAQGEGALAAGRHTPSGARA